jgi:vitamin B12 transporter
MSLFVRARARSAVAAAFPFLGLGVSPIALAQASTASAAETVVVTATRTPQRVDQALAQVTVIDRARIEAASGRTLAELLAGESGVQSWSNGGLGKNASVSLRGLESRHTLLLIDGVRYGSATLGTPSWDNIPLDAIERIEIVRGPMSGLYGSEAVGGVIQIFTRRGQQGFHPEFAAALGSRSYGELAAGARFGSGLVDGSLRLQHRRTDGFSATNPKLPSNYNPDDDGFDQTSVNGRIGLRLGDWRADATLLKTEGTNHYDDGAGVDTRAALRTEVMSLQLAGPVTSAWRTSVRASRSRDDFETLASASAFSTLGTIGTTQTQFGWENQINTPLGTALVLAERVQQEVERPGTPFAVSERSVTGLALGINGEAGAHGWQANVRRDRNSQFGGQTTGSLGYGYELAPGLRATASFGTSFVAPSFNQLYFPGFGNPNLLPEEGRQREVGLVWRNGPVTSRLAYFDNRIRGYISGGPLPTNIPRVKVDGISASVDAVLGAWTLAGSIDSIQPVNATEGTANFGRILPRRVQDSGRLAVDWRGGGFTLGGSLQAFGERFDNANNSTRLGGFATLDLRAEWAFARDWVLAAKLNNAGGKTYETVFGYNQPGREGFVTLRWAPR